MEGAKEEERETASGQKSESKEGGREGERDGPRDAGSATAGCYVSAPPALSPHGLSRLASLQSLTLQPLPTFFFPFHSHGSSHGCLLPSLPPSFSRSLSLHLFLSLSSTHSLHPRGATNLCCLCCHSVSLSFCFLSVCLSLSLIISINRFLSPSPSLLCSEAAAPRSGLQGYDKERPQIHA